MPLPGTSGGIARRAREIYFLFDHPNRANSVSDRPVGRLRRGGRRSARCALRRPRFACYAIVLPRSLGGAAHN